MPAKLRAFISILGLAAVGLCAWLLGSSEYTVNWQALLFFSFLVFLAESFCIDLPKSGAVSITFTIILATIIIFGPAISAIAGLCAAFIWRDLVKGTHPLRWVFNGSQYAISAGAAGVVYSVSGGLILAELNRGFTLADFPLILAPLAMGIVAFFLVNTLLVSIVIGLAEDMPTLNVWLMNVRWAIPNYFALAPLGMAIAQIYMVVGYVGVILIFLPLIVARQTFQIFMRLRNTYLGTVKSLIAALEAKDPYTRGHSERVAELAEQVGRAMKLNPDQMETLRYAGILHDIGKIGTARYILRKPGRLTEEEYQRVQLHPEAGALILREINFLQHVVPVIFHHHEQFDGQGYADGIKGEEIPLLARILTVADAYDAMTSPRPYRPQMESEEACRELIRCSGSQFDPEIVKVFLKSIDFHDSAPAIAKGQMQLDEAPI